MPADREARIRERAYQIWVEEGRVEGRREEHWRRAEREIADEEARATPAAKRPPRARASAAGAAKSATASPRKPRATAAEPATPAPARRSPRRPATHK